MELSCEDGHHYLSGQRGYKSFPFIEFILPETTSCANCEETVQVSGWLEFE